MKATIRFSALLLSTLVLAGCSSCPCKKNAAEAPVAAPVVAAPVVTPVVKAPAPVVAEPATASIPAATRRYIK